ncbi:hypothetical protein SAMN07250955_11657 [Arboricoccus pini]|uniref:Uncharacterized protein n=1 Tax=Arboricoccus pini TaxID=1963835 RepID=A0A212RX50_9PROT|nr:hypothetical protein [Arboricoccus pini]SNB77301.1 hypothetical protein SAMN07250955_11657 [Arboricoccus pini]
MGSDEVDDVDDPLTAEMKAIQAYAILLLGQEAGQAAFESATIETSTAMLYEAAPTLGQFRLAMLRAIDQGLDPNHRPPPSNDPRVDRLAALGLEERRLFLAATLLELTPETIGDLWSIPAETVRAKLRSLSGYEPENSEKDTRN